MRHIERSIPVHRSPDVVWALVSDVERFGRFFVGITMWDPVGEPRHRAGDRYRVLMQVGSIAAGGTIEITALDAADRRLAWAAVDGIGHDGAITVTGRPDGCELKLDFHYQLTGPLAPLTEWLTGPIVERSVVATLDSLRHLAEFESSEEPW